MSPLRYASYRLTHFPGFDFLPDDKSHGYHGGLLEDDGLETPASRRWYQDRRARVFCAALQCPRFRVQGLHIVYESRRSGSELANRRHCNHVRYPSICHAFGFALMIHHPYSFDSDW